VEGFGNVLVEAAYARIPSVAWSCALGVADAIVPGVTGELAISADPIDLADAVSSAVRIEGRIGDWYTRFSREESTAIFTRTIERVLALSAQGRHERRRFADAMR
jgi:glycosyltransferase involved in cell wall biosynthesis